MLCGIKLWFKMLNETVFTVEKTPDNEIKIYSLRLINELQIASHEGFYWLRGIEQERFFQPDIQSVNIRNFWRIDDELLFPIGKKTPDNVTPKLDWKSIKEVLKIDVPISAMGSNDLAYRELSLVKSLQYKSPEGLLTDLTSWSNFVLNSSKFEFESLVFACSDTQEVFITGKQLPSIPGRVFWRHGRGFIPLGKEINPSITPIELNRILNIDNSIIIFDDTGEWFEITEANLLPTSRSAIRETLMEFEK